MSSKEEKNVTINNKDPSLLSYFVFKKWGESKNEMGTTNKKNDPQFTKSLLKKNYETYDIEYVTTSKRANHLSHGLASLYFLGASEERQKDFFEGYSKRLRSLPSKAGATITKENFKDYVDKYECYADLLEFFVKQIEEEGEKKVLEMCLPFISKGMIGAAYHGLIQLGFSFLRDLHDVTQISTGLAYCINCHKEMGELSKTNQTEIPSIDGIVNILRDLGNQKDLLELLKGKENFRERLDAIMLNSYAVDKISKYDIDVKDTHQNVQKMMDSIMEVAYMIGVDYFFIIHLVTAMKSIKNIFSFLYKNSDHVKDFSLINYFWRSVLIAFVTLGCPQPNVDRPFEYNEYDWDSVVKDVLNKDSEVHVLKLIYVAKDENEESKQRNSLSCLKENFYFNFAKKCSQIVDYKFYA